MLDGTEAQLRSRRDLGNIREQPVGVGAIDAANFFDGVQVRQAPSIEDQVAMRFFHGRIDADKIARQLRAVAGARE